MRPQERRPVLSDTEVQDIVDSKKRGRELFGLLESHLLRIGGCITQSEASFYSNKSVVPKRWPKCVQHFPWRSLASAYDSGAPHATLGGKPIGDGRSTYSARVKSVKLASGAISCDIAVIAQTGGDRARSVVAALAERQIYVEESLRLVMPEGQAYRQEFGSSVPRHTAKNRFCRALNKETPSPLNFLEERREGAI